MDNGYDNGTDTDMNMDMDTFAKMDMDTGLDTNTDKETDTDMDIGMGFDLFDSKYLIEANGGHLVASLPLHFFIFNPGSTFLHQISLFKQNFGVVVQVHV
jgi:hypothetical protein